MRSPKRSSIIDAADQLYQDAMSAALATVWSEAQELANESLTAAKQAWETERADADTMRAELAAISPGREQNRDTARCQPTRFLKSVKS